MPINLRAGVLRLAAGKSTISTPILLLSLKAQTCPQDVRFVHYGYPRQFCNIVGGVKSPVIQCEGYLLSCGRYIERNPLEAGLVTEPWQYAWSSCRAYAC